MCGQLLLQDEVIEVASRIDRIVFVETTLGHELGNFLDQFLSHLEKLRPRHCVLAVAHVSGLVGEAGCLEETKYD